MRRFQPTVRQLPPLGRSYHAAPIMSKQVVAHDPEASSPATSTASLARWRRWLPARTSPAA
jgi:hypothetical protein